MDTIKCHKTFKEFLDFFDKNSRKMGFFDNELSEALLQYVWDAGFNSGALHQCQLDESHRKWEDFKDAGY